MAIGALLAALSMGAFILFDHTPGSTAATGMAVPVARIAWTGLVPLRPAERPPLLFGEAESRFNSGIADYRKGDYAKASVAFRKASEAAPGNSELRIYLGSSLLMTRDFAAAVSELKIAAQFAAGERRDIALLLLAKAHMDRGDRTTARETLSKVAATGGPWSEMARSLLTEFAGVP